MVVRVVLDVVALLGLMAVVAMLAKMVGRKHEKIRGFRLLMLGFLLLAFTILFDISQGLGWLIVEPDWYLWADVLRLGAVTFFVAGVFGLRSVVLRTSR